MKIGLVMCGPDVAHGPLALLQGSFEEKAAKAAALGYDGIELMVRDPARLDWSHVKNTLAQAGLEVPQIVTGELFGADGLCLVTADADLHRRAEERIRSVIDMAAYLGAMVNIGRLRGMLQMLGDVADPWGIAVERLRRVVDYAAAREVLVTLEPLNRYETDFVLNAEDGRRLVDDLGCDNFGLMLDLFHMNIEDADVSLGLRQAGDRLWHVHIADSNRQYPGRGHTDFDPIFATLRDMDYHGYVSAEMFPRPDGDTAAARTMEYLRGRVR